MPEKINFHSSMYKNILLLGLSGIIAKLFDFSFRAYYSKILGTEGMGLLSLGFSIHTVMLTFSTAGLGVAVSKITSEYMELNKPKNVKCSMQTAISGVGVLSLAVTLLTFLFSEQISSSFLGDVRVSQSLCTLSPSVIFMGISYCLKGCFYAERKILPPASSEILEQVVKFFAIRLFLHIASPYGTEYSCAAVFLGITVGEFSSCLYLFLWYIKESKRNFGITTDGREKCDSTKSIVLKLLGISIPSMIASLCSSSLRMKEETLIISSFERGGLSHSAAVSSLGIIHGMAMPLLILPLNLAGSVMSLLVPEISRAGTTGGKRLKSVAVKIYKYGAFIGCFVAILFIFFGDKLSTAFYGTDEAASIIVCLAPLCPIMFFDSLSCSVLNGLGKQVRMLFFTLADFALRFSLIYFTLPAGKMKAFCIMVYASNIFTCLLSTGSASKLCGIFKSKLTKSSKCAILKL